MANVDQFNIPYPDFRAGERIESEKIDLNNKKLVDKANEVIVEINNANERAVAHNESGDHDHRYLLKKEGGDVVATVESLKNEVKEIVLGSSDAEVSQARVGHNSKVYGTLKERIDTEVKSKNTVYHGAVAPSSGYLNDVWFKPLTDGQLQLHIYNGTAWVAQSYSAESLKGTLSGATVALTNIDANNIVSNREAFFKQVLSAINPNITLSETELLMDKGSGTVARSNSYKTIDKGVPGFEIQLPGSSPDFRSGNVTVEGKYYKTTSSTPEDVQFYSFKHDMRYFKVTVVLGAAQAAAGARVSLYNISNVQATGSNHYLESEATYTLTVDLGEPTGATTGYYLRLNSGGTYSAATMRILRVWKEG